MVCCKAVALAASVCASIAYGARIKAASKRISEEQPLADQLIRAASATTISLHDGELSLDELLALDDRVMPATARPSVPATPPQMATRSKKRKAPEVPATARPSVPATELHEATLPSAPPKKRKGPETLQHTFDGALQDEVGQNRLTTEAAKEEMLLGNSSAYDIGLEFDEVDHSGTEGGFDISELLNYMADALEDEAAHSRERPVDEAQTSGGSIEDLWGQTLDDVDFEDTMQKYEERKCSYSVKKRNDLLKIRKLEECCKLAHIWSNCNHGKRFLANMLRRFNKLCKRFPSLPRHRIAKAAYLQDLGLLPITATSKRSRCGIAGNWLQSSGSQVDQARDPCVGSIAQMPTARLAQRCADNGTRPVLVARLKAHGYRRVEPAT